MAAKSIGGKTGGEKKASLRPDLATIAGLVLAIGAILTGLVLEGGRVQDVAQITSALIVLGGTVGAVMVTTPTAVLMRALRQLGTVFFNKEPEPERDILEIIEYATLARKHGILSLEDRAADIEDPFLKKALNLAVDGIDMATISSIMELEIQVFEDDAEAEARVFESAGGYSPTIGIIGAVLGLIQVMKNLANIDEVGRGIAVAFVATIYGVGVANVFFLPAAGKLKARARAEVQRRELMLEGVLGIAEGLNQTLIRMKLEAYSRNPARAQIKPQRGKVAPSVTSAEPSGAGD